MRLNLEKHVTSAQSPATDPPRLTRPTRTPSTVRAPPLSPWKCLVVTFIFKKKILYWLPYVAAAFLCAEHALTDVAPICLNICLALAFTKDWNLRWRWSGFFFFWELLEKYVPKEKQKGRKDPTSISLRVSDVKLVSVRPQPRRDTIIPWQGNVKRWFSLVWHKCNSQKEVFTCNYSVQSTEALIKRGKAYRGEG